MEFIFINNVGRLKRKSGYWRKEIEGQKPRFRQRRNDSYPVIFARTHAVHTSRERAKPNAKFRNKPENHAR